MAWSARSPIGCQQVIEADAAIYHVVKQIIIASLHGHPQPLVIEAARSGIAHANQPAFAEVFDGLRGTLSHGRRAQAATANEPSRARSSSRRSIVEGHGGHHGGAWKVAYADFVTAMMAFFLLMWLLGATTEKQRKALADYFAPTLVEMKQNSAGSNGMFGGDSITDKDNYPHKAQQTGTRSMTDPGRCDRAAIRSAAGRRAR